MRNAAKRVFVVCARFVFNVLYRFFCLFSRKDEILFASRQANTPSHDYLALGCEFAKRGYTPVYLNQKLSKKTAFKYAVHVILEIYHLARCRACFLDRYDPVVGFIKFKSTSEELDLPLSDSPFFHNSFPVEPVVVQIWHAFGAFKKFGYQSHDTSEGHSLFELDLYRVHANYSWILCSGEGCRSVYAEAFGYPKSRVALLHRPEYDELRMLRQEEKLSVLPSKNILKSIKPESGDASDRPTVLFAPTLRKEKTARHPFRELYQGDEWRYLNKLALVEWSFHPLEALGVASGGAEELLQRASIVVTDYSSIVYEAFLLGKKVLFYTPDIDQYRLSPGLNTDPMVECPQLVFLNKKELLKYIDALLRGLSVYPEESLSRFAKGAIAEYEGNATERLVDAAIRWIAEKE